MVIFVEHAGTVGGGSMLLLFELPQAGLYFDFHHTLTSLKAELSFYHRCMSTPGVFSSSKNLSTEICIIFFMKTLSTQFLINYLKDKHNFFTLTY